MHTLGMGGIRLSGSPRLSPGELSLLAAGAVLMALLMNWPLPLQMGDRVPSTLVDPLLQAWEVAWGGHALLRHPLQLFDTNAFWPLRDALAFSDPLLGYAPVGLIGKGATAALIRYNVLHLFAYALAFAGAYLLARELGAAPLAAVVAGVAFAYSPWRLSQSDHLNILSSGGIPLSLFLLLRGYRAGRPWVVLAGWGVATWQMSLGFGLGLQFGYLLGILAALALVMWLRRRTPIPRQVVMATAVGVALFLGWTAVQARPYLRVVQAHPEARRTAAEVSFFSPPKKGLLAAPEQSLVWGPLTAPMRRSLPWPQEQTLFPGGAIAVLALAGLWWRGYPGSLRLGLAVGAVVAVALSLGFGLVNGRFTYRPLYELAPGWQGIRTPGRLMTLASLFLAMLAAAGAERMANAVRTVTARPPVPVAFSLLLAGAVVLDGAGRLTTLPVPPVPKCQPELADPQLHLPFLADPVYMYWSTEGFPRIVNGYSGFAPRSHREILAVSTGFPDLRSVNVFRSLGVRTVVLHADLARGTQWEEVASRSVDGLPVRRVARDKVIVYELAPGRDGEREGLPDSETSSCQSPYAC